ncbi:pyocin knob domain-containing protein [Maricaulis maris]|uniref:pyocin knob domain-containing protein n=1 Tax=Maricaulis maris TaxID=74318 RepID=UPI003A8EFC3D
MSSFENFVKCRVVSPVAAAATDIALHEAVAPFNLPPEEGGILVLTDSPNNPSVIEVIRYGYRNALGLYDVQRGQEGTTAIAWTGPVYCYQSLMAGDFQALLDSKVDKAAGEFLMLDAERTKLAGIAAGAQVNSVTSVAGRTGSVTLAKADVGLGNADNTSDASKPVSTAQQTALNAKVDKVTGKGLSTNDLTAALLTKLNAAAPLASPALTGNPTAPTPAAGDADTSIATTAFVRAAMALFGVGVETPTLVPDLNAATEGGFYRYATSAANAPLASIGQLLVLPYGGATIQVAIDRASQRLFVRSITTSSPVVWSEWKEFWSTGNLVKQTSPTDTTAGALMAVGAFGIGSTALSDIASADNLSAGGVYRFGINTVGRPPFIDYGTIVAVVRSSAEQTQLAQSTNTNEIAIRYKVGGAWSTWQEIWHTGNLVKQAGSLDSTPGSMMEVGAFGLGSVTPPSAGDPDNLGTVMIHTIPSGSDKNPFGTIGGVGLNLQSSLSWGAQLFVAAGGSNLQIKARNRTSAGVWGPLFDLFHTGNILGTVSQSGGVPTGAIIEYGSNANGRYVRFADGTQICIHSRNGGSSWTFPAVFIDTPYVYATVAGLTSEGRMVGVAGTSTTSTSLYMWTAAGAASAAGANLLAVGRWY